MTLEALGVQWQAAFMPSSAHEDMPGEVREQLVFSPPTWDLEIELRSRGLVASASAH